VDLSSFLPRASEHRTGGIALSSALLAVPALVAGHPRAGVILVAASVVAAVFFERRSHSGASSRTLPTRALTVVPPLSRSRPAHAAPQARWEIVEHDGKRSLSMRWR